MLNQCTLSVYFICESFNLNSSGIMSENVSQRLATPVSYCTKCRWAQLWTRVTLCCHSYFLPKSHFFLNNMYFTHFKFFKGSNNFQLIFIAFGNLASFSALLQFMSGFFFKKSRKVAYFVCDEESDRSLIFFLGN